MEKRKTDKEVFWSTTRCECQKCFPADATARVEGRGDVPMAELKLGDKVLAERADGAVGYEAVIEMEPTSSAGDHTYYSITTAAGKTLRATKAHKVYTVEGGCVGSAATAERAGASKRRAAMPHNALFWGTGRLRAQDVHLKHATGAPIAVWTFDATVGGLVCDDVVATGAVIEAKGLYNPRTASGTIIVDGVLAAAESQPSAAAALLEDLSLSAREAVRGRLQYSVPTLK